MKLLALVHRFPYPPVRGDSIRSWGQVEHLAREHDVWLACVDRATPWPAHLAQARRCCRDVAVVVRSGVASLVRGGVSLLAGRSLTEGYFHDRRLARIVRQWSDSVGFDAVLTFSPAMAPYAALVSARRRVLDMNDVESQKWAGYARRSLPPLSWFYALESRRLPKSEAAWVQAHDVTLLVNERERSKLPADLTQRSAVVPIGLDLSRYRMSQDRAGRPIVPHEPIVGILGSMSYAPNVRAVNWFGRFVWPLVKRAVPAARWLIVGRHPVHSVRRWGRRRDITVTGLVEDVRPYLRSMRVFICPVREQIGVQTKLIEALAAARAAVVTPQAAAGMDHDDPPPFVIAGSPAEFARSVVHLLRDEAHAQSLAARGRALVEAKYDARVQGRRVAGWLAKDKPEEPRGLPRETVLDEGRVRELSEGGREVLHF